MDLIDAIVMLVLDAIFIVGLMNYAKFLNKIVPHKPGCARPTENKKIFFWMRLWGAVVLLAAGAMILYTKNFLM